MTFVSRSTREGRGNEQQNFSKVSEVYTSIIRKKRLSLLRRKNIRKYSDKITATLYIHVHPMDVKEERTIDYPLWPDVYPRMLYMLCLTKSTTFPTAMGRKKKMKKVNKKI